MKRTILFFLIAAMVISIVNAASTGGGGQTPYVQQFDERKLSCSNESTLRERVACRYNLPENYKELNFLPEECKQLGGKARDDCLFLYDKARPCWAIKDWHNQESCLKEKVWVFDINAEKQKCSDTACLYALRTKVYSVVKLRFYALEERAEKLGEHGASKESIINLVTDLEQQKLNFNKAKTVDERKAIVQHVKDLWKGFRKKTVEEIKAKGDSK